ncbi:cholecystokinin receptor type A-like [Babylonia areolata]|uniref:cholecystokinin receptor type A-like n=1 Tax=Babylonia areolata TaxID=304850 RepID=UPI003FD6BFE5
MPQSQSSQSQIPVIIQTIQKDLQVLFYNYTIYFNSSYRDGDLPGDATNDDDGEEEDPSSQGDLLGQRNASGNGSVGGGVYVVPRLSMEIQIVLYSLIFLLAVVGNFLVLVTLFQNKRMRTVTNVFLLNLALSDLLLAVFCMPFTLVPVLLRDFVFGAAMCVLIRYLQAVSVGVSCFTLVAISLERYFAICRPLHSRSWQTLSHAYRCIAVCWVLAALLMTPVAVFQRHQRLSSASGAHSCREIWPDPRLEKAYTVLLDLALLVLPVLLMSLAYVSVVHALIYDVRSPSSIIKTGGVGELGEGEVVLPNYRTIELRLLGRDSMRSITSVSSTEETCLSRSATIMSGIGPPLGGQFSRTSTLTDLNNPAGGGVGGGSSSTTPKHKGRAGGRHHTHRIRHSNPRKIRENKIRVIRMLFVVVLEFFLCWTPLYVIQTWMIFDLDTAYQHVTPLTKSLLHLLSYVSSCTNPITYCFMNKKFREGFVRVFTCRRPPPPLKERQRQHLLMLQDSRRSERYNPMASLTAAPRGTSVNAAKPMIRANSMSAGRPTNRVNSAKAMIRASSVRQFEFVNNINPIEEHSAEDCSQS